MLKKIISIISVVVFASLLCALPPVKNITPNEFSQIEMTYNNILQGLSPETVAQFDTIIMGLLPEMGIQGSMNEERLITILKSNFPNGVPDMTEESALFFLGFHLYQKDKDQSVAEPKSVTSAPMANTDKSKNMVKSISQLDDNETACLEVCKKYYQIAKSEQERPKSGHQKLRD
ncbi:MAG: hypothetical protein JW737_03230 [Acidobacteria bacterium]|nr:hypothetical protein [Acidobacteriota bacterium]